MCARFVYTLEATVANTQWEPYTVTVQWNRTDSVLLSNRTESNHTL